MKIFTTTILLSLAILLNSCGHSEQKKYTDKLNKTIVELNIEKNELKKAIEEHKCNTPTSSELNECRDKLTKSTRQINTQKDTILSLNRDNGKLKKQLQTNNTLIASLRKTIVQRDKKLKEIKIVLTKNQGKISKLNNQIKTYQKQPKIIKKVTPTDDGFAQVVRGKRKYATIKGKPNIIKDTLRGLYWQKEDDGKTRTHKEAEKYCNTLSIDGIDKWRLPTMEELYYLADRTQKGVKIDENYFKKTKSNYYWTSTPYKHSSSSSFWVVHFGDGSGFWTNATDSLSVRCVRQ